jgi:guanine deaminase
MRSVKDNTPSLKVGLGSDVGAGTSLSLLRTMGEAYKVAKLSSFPMNAAQLLYLATLGSARALASDDRVGSLEVGKDADIVILDPRATPIQELCNERATTTEEKLFLFGVLGDDRSVTATYVAGNLLYQRSN